MSNRNQSSNANASKVAQAAATATGGAVLAGTDSVSAAINSSEGAQRAVMGTADGAAISAAAEKLFAAGAKPGLKIISRAPSFRRAGREFTAEPTFIPMEQLDEDTAELLLADPDLVTVKCFIEPPSEAEEEQAEK